jgi:hypothetical protein
VTDEPTPPQAEATAVQRPDPQPPTETADPAAELSEAAPLPELAAEPQPSLPAGAEPAPEPSVAEPPAAPAPEAKASRRRLALGLAGALVAVAAGGGIGYAVLNQGRNQDAGKKTTGKAWKAPEPKRTGAYGATSGGSHYGALRKLLLPMPETYVPGPDVAEFGNDAQLSGKQASDLVKERYRSLPKKQRETVRKAVDRLGIQGIGMRTYSTYGGSGGATDGEAALVVEIRLLQMTNKRAARAATDFFAAATEGTGVLRKGPTIAGHPKARCVLPPLEKGVPLDSMYCEATEGDLVISLSASGTTPLQKDDAAKLLKQQLDRVKDPGEAA